MLNCIIHMNTVVNNQNNPSTHLEMNIMNIPLQRCWDKMGQNVVFR